MRLLIDTLVALMLAGMLGGVLWFQNQSTSADEELVDARQSLRRIQQEIAYHAAIADVPLTGRGFPRTVDPEWFDGNLPENDLVKDARPWLEIVSVEQANLKHPPVRVLLDESYAAFWYNPYEGIVRARVPVNVSDELTLYTYNALNDSDETVLIDPSAINQLVAVEP